MVPVWYRARETVGLPGRTALWDWVGTENTGGRTLPCVSVREYTPRQVALYVSWHGSLAPPSTSPVIRTGREHIFSDVPMVSRCT